MRHAERLKDVYSGEFGEGFSGRAFYDYTQEKIVRVAVDELFPGRIVQSFLTRYQSKNTIGRG